MRKNCFTTQEYLNITDSPEATESGGEVTIGLIANGELLPMLRKPLPKVKAKLKTAIEKKNKDQHGNNEERTEYQLKKTLATNNAVARVL